MIIVECESLAGKWEQLSGFIGLPSTLIDRIRLDYPNDCSCCWNKAINHWIKQNYNTEKFGKPSWKTLLGAIVHIDRHLFEKLASKHKGCDPIGDSVVPFTDEHHSQATSNEGKHTDYGCCTTLHFQVSIVLSVIIAFNMFKQVTWI